MHLPTKRREFDEWSPILSFQRQVNRLFDDVFGGFDVEPLGAQAWAPALDVQETDEALIVRAELPGVDAKEVNISIEGDVLTIAGEKKEDKNANYHRLERRYGSFSRSIRLPSAIDTDKVKTSAKNGVLEVNLPKKEEAKPKKIEIGVAE